MSNPPASQTVLESIADVVHAVRYEDLPRQVIDGVKALVLDTLGCAYGAMGSELAEAVRHMAADCGGVPRSTLIGTGEKTSPAMAAFVNGSLLRYLDCNDYVFARDPAHPSGNVSVALAMAEHGGRSGPAMIAALVAAYEVHLRFAEAAGDPSLWKRGWHHGTNAQFSSAALASRLGGLDRMRTAHAMAIAGSHQNTLAQLQSGSISMIKATAEAWVAKAGVEAAMLARHGVTGPLSLIEGTHGWADTVAGKVDVAVLRAPFEGNCRLRDVCIKPYPVVATALAPVRAAIDLHREGLPPLGDIRKVVVSLPAFALNTPSAHPDRRYPTSIGSAQHSFYFCPVVALLDGACGQAQFAPARLSDGRLRELLGKVELTHEPTFDARWPETAGGSVALHCSDGSVRVSACPYPPGHPRLPLSEAELAEKFHAYADPVLGRTGASALRDAVLDLEHCTDIRNLGDLLAVH